jgi:predicted KAP-like P-loop ATPase
MKTKEEFFNEMKVKHVSEEVIKYFIETDRNIKFSTTEDMDVQQIELYKYDEIETIDIALNLRLEVTERRCLISLRERTTGSLRERLSLGTSTISQVRPKVFRKRISSRCKHCQHIHRRIVW